MELPDEYRDLVHGYLTSLETTIVELETRLSHAEIDLDELDALREIAHKLAGNGASFGFPDITEQAKKVTAGARAYAARSGAFDTVSTATRALVVACQDAMRQR
ncbi:MAG: Hpt domain-containing protein [Myxococcota bacterium]